MNKTDINSLDVKVLKLLIEIAENGSVSIAAQRRGITQSAASYGLVRLRETFNDPLFIRAGRGVTPTQRGEEIVEVCKNLLKALEETIEPKEFDPLTESCEFIISATGYEVQMVIADLAQELRVRAPNICLNIKGLDLGALVSDLENHCDLALMSSPQESPYLKQSKLFTDKHVTYYDSSVRSAPDSLDVFCEAPHAISTFGGKKWTEVDDLLKQKKRHRKIKLSVNYFEALPTLMRNTDLITTIPLRLSEAIMQDFDYTTCPLDVPELPIHSVWHVKKDQDVAHKWLRSLIFKICKAKFRK